MELFCPACQASFTGLNRCPRCGGRVLRADEVTAADAGRPDRLQPTPAVRVAVGLAVGLGVYLGLAELAAGLQVATGPVSAGLRAVAVLAGALLAGAGGRGGFGIGAVVGGVFGGSLLTAEVLAMVGWPPHPTALTAGLVVVGGLAGLAGARVWPAAPVLQLQPVGPPSGEAPRQPAGRSTAWPRVLVGAAVLAAGVVLADPGRVRLQKATGGLLRVESRGEGRLMSAALAVLGGLAGGAVAAAGTGAGPRHGGLAGAVASAGVVGWMMVRDTLPVPAAALLGQLGLAGGDPTDPAGLAAVAAGTAALGLAGGWFGGVLFPKLAPRSMWYPRIKVGGD